MIRKILSEAGITAQETRFIQPPKSTYAVWFDDQIFRGADDRNNLIEHAVSIELYEYRIDFDSEVALEKTLDARKLPFHKSDRQWLNTENLYMVVYTFNFIEKRVFNHGR